VWRCAVCGTENALASELCSACGASFARTIRPEGRGAQDRDPGAAALVSLFCPGAGHAWLGLWGQAAARFVISAWATGVAVLSALQKGSGAAAAAAVVFGLVATFLWVAGAHDAYREAQGHPRAVLLTGRRIVYLMVGLLVLLMLLLMVQALSVGSAA
jgi:hypothetical protein